MSITLPSRYAHLAQVNVPWLAAAIKELGQSEIPGAKSNARIMAYREMAETPLGGDDGAVPWCAIFINAMLREANAAGSGSAMARSFLSSKNFIRLSEPAIGAIGVKSSASRGAAAGHVGFYVGEDRTHVHLLGGNQDDQVNVSPFRTREFLGFMWPKSAPAPVAPWDKPYRIAPGGGSTNVRDA